jgi:ABC-2 type transport system permease protein
VSADAPAELRAEPRPVDVTWPRRLYWEVRRELWESRSVYLVPVAVAALIVVGFGLGLVHLPDRLRAAAALDALHRQAALERPYVMAALLLMFATVVVGIFYCLEALYGERRDRGILFWKSLPVSDTTAVLAKASVPILILPLLTFVVTVATQAIMLFLASARLIGTGLSPWSQLSFGQMSTILLLHLVLVHGLWYAPFWAWLLLVSAWSRRAPFLWATLPPLAVGIVEKIAFDTSNFVTFLGHRLMGVPRATGSAGEPTTMASIMPGSPGEFLASPGLWLGLALTAALLWAAVRLRRHRGPVEGA